VRALAVRLDSDGDVLLTGPAIRALAAGVEAVDLLVSPAGAAAARLLPGVAEVLVFDPPWAGYRPPPVDPQAVTALVQRLAGARYELAVIFTSFHQSPLPMALVARMAGIPRVAADCVDYPGSLLDVRHQRREVHEVQAALELAAAAGAALPAGDDGRLAVNLTGIEPVSGIDGQYVVLHPGASVPARALSAEHAREVVAALSAAGWKWPSCCARRRAWWWATPARRTWPPPSGRRWCRCSPPWCRPRDGPPTASRPCCWATSTRCAGTPERVNARSPAIRA
jgi:heptosyltransferase-3